MLFAATPHAQKLEGVYPLEGSSIKSYKKPHKNNHTQNDMNNMTFELFIRKQFGKIILKMYIGFYIH